MENEKLQIVVNSKDGKVLLGNDYHILNDETSMTYKTSSIVDFINSLDPKRGMVFYDESICKAYEILSPAMNLTPIAICEIQKANVLEYLMGKNDRRMTIGEFEEFVRTIRKYLRGEHAIKLIDFIDNIQLCKVRTLKRTQDHQGNFTYTYSAEKGQGDFEFPKELKLEIPIIQDFETNIEILFDFYFSWEDKEDGPRQRICYCNR